MGSHFSIDPLPPLYTLLVTTNSPPPRAPESNVFPPQKNLFSLDDPKRKESNLFLPVFP